MGDDGTILIGGRNLVATRKAKSVLAGNDRVAVIVDDLESVQPWRPRGIRIYGRAELLRTEGQFGPGDYLEVTPEVSWSWGIEESPGGFHPHRTEHRPRPGAGS